MKKIIPTYISTADLWPHTIERTTYVHAHGLIYFLKRLDLKSAKDFTPAKIIEAISLMSNRLRSEIRDRHE